MGREERGATRSTEKMRLLIQRRPRQSEREKSKKANKRKGGMVGWARSPEESFLESTWLAFSASCQQWPSPPLWQLSTFRWRPSPTSGRPAVLSVWAWVSLG